MALRLRVCASLALASRVAVLDRWHSLNVPLTRGVVYKFVGQRFAKSTLEVAQDTAGTGEPSCRSIAVRRCIRKAPYRLIEQYCGDHPMKTSVAFLVLSVTTALAVPIADAQETSIVRGQFTPLNALASDLSGTVSLSRVGDELEIVLTIAGAPAGMHLAHIHGFPEAEPAEATCPGPNADANGDGYVDLIETRDSAGVTMVPFTEAPASLEIQAQSYPTASADGDMAYEQTVEVSALSQALGDQFGTPLALEQRVVFIHGAPADATLPDSVQSLDAVPASVTVPIACAELQ